MRLEQMASRMLLNASTGGFCLEICESLLRVLLVSVDDRGEFMFEGFPLAISIGAYTCVD